jgi:hypothetical protein
LFFDVLKKVGICCMSHAARKSHNLLV